MSISDQEILDQLMDFTTVDLINVTAYLAMSLGEFAQDTGQDFDSCFSSGDVLQWNYLGDRRQEIYPARQQVLPGCRFKKNRNHFNLLRTRTNVHYLVLHLTIADSIVCFIVLPLEAAWRFTIQWRAGNLACKLLMAVRALGYYLSSAVLVAICIDRSFFNFIKIS